ncbi:MAG: hypothetical protein EA409_00015, partial [Saprospirales bacterium]
MRLISTKMFPSVTFLSYRKTVLFYLLIKIVFILIPAQIKSQDLEVFIGWVGNSQNYPLHRVTLNSGFEYCEAGELLGNFPPGSPFGTVFDLTYCPDSKIYWVPLSGPNAEGLVQLNPETQQVLVIYDQFPFSEGVQVAARTLACKPDTTLYSAGGSQFNYPLYKTHLGEDSSVLLGNFNLYPRSLFSMTNLHGDLYFTTILNQPYPGERCIYKVDTDVYSNPEQLIDFSSQFQNPPRGIGSITASPYCSTLIGIIFNAYPHIYGYEAEACLFNIETGELAILCTLEYSSQNSPVSITSEYETLSGPCELLLDLDGDGSSGAGGHDYLSPDTVSCLSNEGARIADEDVFIAKDAPISFMTIEILSPHTGEYLDLIGSVAGLTVSGQ